LVVILEMPGHTPGLTALQLTMPESGTILLTGDLYHMNQSRKLRLVPRFNTNEAETRESMVLFESIASELGAKVIIQHEPEDVALLPKPPQFLQ
jgi:N-acyl homoserine lactone hydrolase